MWVFVKVGKGGYGFKYEFGDGGNFFCESIFLIEVIFNFSVFCKGMVILME